MKEKLKKFKQSNYLPFVYGIGSLLLIIFSNLYLQWCQNELSIDLALKFAFSWHTEKFFLGCFVLSIYFLFLWSFIGSIKVGTLVYSISLFILGFADYQKMFYREEPIYPDDLKMITELSLLKEMVGLWPFLLIIFLAFIALFFFFKAFYRNFFLSEKRQILRVAGLVISLTMGWYITDFNNPNNLLRQAYNKTALWIPYSQKMNYYNTGFIGGFLYNLKVEAMTKPNDYSKQRVKAVVNKYQKLAQETSADQQSEQPNIVFIMSESFSDPTKLAGLSIKGNPLKNYQEIANKTYSGQMLSQNYGGGTANIEFEALTSFSMELLNAQMTTPYTMLIPKMTKLPSIVSLLEKQNYQTTAIHPYNTSMYKRHDVYDILGFDQFINEENMTFTSTLENNPYISDASAYKEVLQVLKAKQPQFIHLVTMQTHMPYENKYSETAYQATGNGNNEALNNYMQDIAYSSEAFYAFIQEIQKLSRRTLVVFWGDHLPSIYSENVKAANQEVDLHQTEFLMYDTANQLSLKQQHNAQTSPFYFAPTLFQQSNLPQSGFYALLNQVQTSLPAFEKNFFYVNNQWQSTLKLSDQQQALYEDYQLIQYDIVAGEKYSMEEGFFEN